MEDLLMLMGTVLGGIMLGLFGSLCFPHSEKRVAAELSLLVVCVVLSFGVFMGVGLYPTAFLPADGTVQVMSRSH